MRGESLKQIVRLFKMTYLNSLILFETIIDKLRWKVLAKRALRALLQKFK